MAEAQSHDIPTLSEVIFLCFLFYSKLLKFCTLVEVKQTSKLAWGGSVLVLDLYFFPGEFLLPIMHGSSILCTEFLYRMDFRWMWKTIQIFIFSLYSFEIKLFDYEYVCYIMSLLEHNFYAFDSEHWWTLFPHGIHLILVSDFRFSGLLELIKVLEFLFGQLY